MPRPKQRCHSCRAVLLPPCTAGAALPQGFQAQALVKLLGCGLGAGAAASFGLKQLAGSGQLASPTARRLQLGLMGCSAGLARWQLACG